MSEKLKRIKLSNIIIGHLKEMIQKNNLTYGDKLPVEKQLAEMFGVSRTTIREALSVLSAEGWVTAKRGDGTYVDHMASPLPIDPLPTLLADKNTAIFELMEFRKIVECEVAVLAALRASKEDISAIKAAYYDMTEAVIQNKETATSDFSIHYAIAKAAKNNTILSVITHLHHLYEQVVTTSREHWSKPSGYELVLSEHRAIITAIENRKTSAARRAMEIHLERSQRIIEELLGPEDLKKHPD